MSDNFDNIQKGHREQVDDLKTEISNLRNEIKLMKKENRNLEDEHKKLSLDKELSVKMLSQTIINLEKVKDDEYKNLTQSMRNIEDEAKSKLEDLHTAIITKND